jgi:hypothetical protein
MERESFIADSKDRTGLLLPGGADVRPDFNWNGTPVAMLGYW